ncbi:endo-beta-N-acetylglucosaminidase H [Chryseobacterium sp. PTM-20240506]|uniref:endo-beta-N-acetylglucosaminidase H n=1 Tax=unclassified Chryseobacterium TaxID=2593645 RepID=UPI00235835B2|nr:endo-beta-N-acetylglucosaminidase H [Chryseobacterium sp. B21-037]MDC8103043.1 RICIN domain-containing protein [Chryseobacterium sp. B21-037]
MKKISLLSLLILLIGVFSVISCNSDPLDDSVTPQENSLSAKSSLTSKVAAFGKNPLSVMYVEVNNNDIREVGKYKLADGRQLFDVAIIFAANINYNTTTQKAYLYFNPQVTNVLSNKNTYIKPLQDKGIKVMLSILGNHQGAGFANFPSQAAAQAFAQELADAVNTYGLDGIDFDDEYANYGANGTGQANQSSFVYLVTALRDLLPDKIISFYNIGPSASNLSYNGVTVGSKVDYAWNPYYSTYSAPNIPGLDSAHKGAAAVNVNSSTSSYTSTSTVSNFAQRTKDDRYGVFLYYDLGATNIASYFTNATSILYGQNTVYGDGTTTPTTGITSGATYQLVSATNGTSMLDVLNAGTTDGTKVQLWASNGNTAQKWKITDVGGGYYKLQPLNAPTKSLDVSNSGTTNGTQVQIYTDNGTNAQKWKITSVGNDYYTLSPAHASGFNLDVNNGSSANGTKIQIWTANTGNAQKWKLVKL